MVIDAKSGQQIVQYITSKLDYLLESRPTAVDLSNAIALLKTSSHEILTKSAASDDAQLISNIRENFITVAEKILEDDHATNKAIGRYGAEYLRRLQRPSSLRTEDDQLRFYTTSPPDTQGAPDQTYRKFSVLTHCNTGYTSLLLSSSQLHKD